MNTPGWYLLLILLFSLSALLRYPLLFFFAVLIGCASLASKLWLRYCLAGVTYRRELGSSRLSFGEETSLTIEVSNVKPLPLAWLLVLDDFPLEVSLLTKHREAKDKMRILSNLMSLRWYERVRRTYRIRGDQRGEFSFGPANIISGDVFGFAWQSRAKPEVDKLLVYPKVVPFIALGLPPAWPLAEEQSRYRLLEDPLRLATVREYLPGDSTRYLHWKATARRQQLQTKVFDPGASHVSLLFTDVQTSTNPYEVIPEYLELAISATASLAAFALSSGHSVALYANGGVGHSSHCLYVPASRHAAQIVHILEALARLDAFRQLPLSSLLHRERPNLPYGGTIVAISAMAGEAILGVLLELQNLGHPVVLLTIGEQPIQAPGGLQVYHLGGRDAWHRLEALQPA